MKLLLTITLIACLALNCGTLNQRAPEMTPFTRAVVLIYAGNARHAARQDITQALAFLDLVPGKTVTVTARAFDEFDQPLRIDPSSLLWTSTENVKVEPAQGRATVKVTLLGGSEGRITVNVSGHKGEVKVRSKSSP